MHLWSAPSPAIARIATLKDGDANTMIFHLQCSYRKQKNRVHNLALGDRVLVEQTNMARPPLHTSTIC